MGYYCTVPQCTSLAGKTKNVKFHRFPRDVTMADKWNLILKRGKPYTKYSKVCSLHFTQADYNVTAMGQWKTLSKDAVPSQNLPKLNPDGTVMVIRKSRTVRYKDGPRDSTSDKQDKWSMHSHTSGMPHGNQPTSATAADPTHTEPMDSTSYRLQALSAIASNLSPPQHTQMVTPHLKPKKQDAFMQTDPIPSEDEDTSQPNNSYSEASETSYNSEQIDYSYKDPKEYTIQNSPYNKEYTNQNSTFKDPNSKEYIIDNSYKEQKEYNIQSNSPFKDEKSYLQSDSYKGNDGFNIQSAFKDPKEYTQSNINYKDAKEFTVQNNLVYKDDKDYQLQNTYKDVSKYNMQSQNGNIYKDQKEYTQNNTIYKNPKDYSVESTMCYKDTIQNCDKKYIAKDYSKNDDYLPQTNEEYNKEAEKYALERKSHKIDIDNTQNRYDKIDNTQNRYEKIDNNQNPYEKTENESFQRPMLENGYQKISDLYGGFDKDFQNRNEYQIGYQNGYSDSAELLRSQQHNLQILQEQHRLLENQGLLSCSPIKQEVDVTEDDALSTTERHNDAMFVSAGERDVMHQQRLLEHLHHQVKQEPDIVGGDSVIIPQDGAFYTTNGHTNVSGGYYDTISRPGPELLIAKQNALAAHTQLWQNSMKRPFFYGEGAHYASPLLSRYSTEDLTRILQ